MPTEMHPIRGRIHSQTGSPSPSRQPLPCLPPLFLPFFPTFLDKERDGKASGKAKSREWLPSFTTLSPSPHLKSLLQQYSVPPPLQLCSHHSPSGKGPFFHIDRNSTRHSRPLFSLSESLPQTQEFTENSFVLVLDQGEFSGTLC